MGYTILDILDKLIKIEIKIKEIYIDIANLTQVGRIEIVSRILIKEKSRNIEYYKNIRKESSLRLQEDIDFDIYDKISFLINQFNMRIRTENLDTLEKLLDYALEYEEMNRVLLIDIQGRLLRTEDDNKTTAYKVLSEIIFERQIYINNIKSFIRVK